MTLKNLLIPILILAGLPFAGAQDHYELNSDWKCLPSTKTEQTGEAISQIGYPLTEWKPAVVPGTVLTTQLANGEIPDPFYGMNNEKIPDVYQTGRDYYTYWFVRDFEEKAPEKGQQVWLTFRGINYSCDIYLNGLKVNKEPYAGMFLRKTFNITSLLAKDGHNRLAVIVRPPDPVGEPNGGQGGDGRIARNLTHQYVAGWDWIQPVRDRNTGIWDKVYIEKTGEINLQNPHVVTLVPGVRKPEGSQKAATLNVSVELQNAGDRKITGTVKYTFDQKTVSRKIDIDPDTTIEAELPPLKVENPKLWWPANYGPQNLSSIKIEFVEDSQTVASDHETVTFGFREIQTDWNSHTRSKQISVNGQKIFIKGGNWIISDAMLRFSKDRYDAEIRHHRDMNLNLIRIWGGALTERPEFYEACDKYGLLVIQDFWFSADCNGRWRDAQKADDQWTRRKYPDDHKLVLEAAVDMVKMIRNHPSLAIWCGGNEMKPPGDILAALRDEILPNHDGTRWFIEFSNANDMSYNSTGENGDGPYTIQPIETFWEKRTWPFNSEVGSVGVGDYESLERFIPEENMNVPVYDPKVRFNETADPVWTYHTYTGVGYEGFLMPYGKPEDIHDFCMKAQLVNYDQYRGLMEGFSSHMWDWYTGMIIWKTQNPWTSMRGQMYDCYLDPNACLYGTRKGSESLHPMYNPVTGMLMVTNNSFEAINDVMLVIKMYDIDGIEQRTNQIFCYIDPSDSQKIMSTKARLDGVCREKGGFMLLELRDENQNLLTDNFYWFPNEKGQYSGLNEMKKAKVDMKAKTIARGKIEVTVSNPKENTIAFFNRIALVDAETGKRILPAFYDDNYISVIPGTEKKITVEYTPLPKVTPQITILGWNVEKQSVPVE